MHRKLDLLFGLAEIGLVIAAGLLAFLFCGAGAR